MRIALLSHLASAMAPTGAEHSLALLATGLAQRDHEVSVAAPGAWSLAPSLAGAGIETVSIPCRSCWLVSYQPQPWPAQVARALRFAMPDPGRRSLEIWLSRLQPHVVHVNCLPHLRGAAAAHAVGCPVVWHLREILPRGPRRRWFASILRRRADRLVAVSEAVAGWLREEGLGDRVEVVHNGVAAPRKLASAADARRGLGIPPGECVVGLLGQLLPHKGVLELVRAGHRAVAEEPGLRFVIAGDGPVWFRKRVESEIEAGPGASRISLVPPQKDVWRLMAAVDVVAVTTLTPDPLPRVVLEAMAVGRPVIAFDGGGVGEMVVDEETGLLVQSGDIEGLVHGLRLLARDPELRAGLGAAGAERVARHFSFRLHLDRMERVLIDVAGS
jgi:glycosyltransferase involved in cell wall biosynthesis